MQRITGIAREIGSLRGIAARGLRDLGKQGNKELQTQLRARIALTKDQDSLLRRSLFIEPKMTEQQHRQKVPACLPACLLFVCLI